LPALRYATIKSGITSLILSKLDIFNGFGDIKVCTKYEGGDLMCGANLATAKPIYKNVSGWQDAADRRQIGNFIDLIEDYVGLPVEYVSSGVGENDIRKWYENDSSY